MNEVGGSKPPLSAGAAPMLIGLRTSCLLRGTIDRWLQLRRKEHRLDPAY